MKKLNLKRLSSNIAIRLVQSRAQNDPEFLADISKAFLNKYFKLITKADFLYYFENDKDLSELVSPNLEKLGEYAKKVHLDTKQVKELINLHMPNFEIGWVKDWWKTDHKHLYAALVNQPVQKQKDMEIWIVDQVEEIVKKLTSKL